MKSRATRIHRQPSRRRWPEAQEAKNIHGPSHRQSNGEVVRSRTADRFTNHQNSRESHGRNSQYTETRVSSWLVAMAMAEASRHHTTQDRRREMIRRQDRRWPVPAPQLLQFMDMNALVDEQVYNAEESGLFYQMQ